MNIRLLPALLVYCAIAVAPSDAHAFGTAWKGVKWTGRQFKKILPPYGGGKKNPPGLSCNTVGEGNFNACYYDDMSLSQLKVVRTENQVDFDFGNGSPDGAIGADTFSARFAGNFDFDGASYTFSVTGDDGVRLYIDDQLVIDEWFDHGPVTYTTERAMSAGRHKILLQYYENQGSALVRLNWTQAGGGGGTNPPNPTDGPFTQAQIPNEQALISQVDAQNPGLMRSNCKAFQSKVMEALRAKDNHWGYCNYGSYTPEDRFMYGPGSAMVDAIVSACSSSATVGWRTEPNDPNCVWSATNSHPGGTPPPGGGGSQYPPPVGPPNDEYLAKEVDAANPGLIHDCVGRPIANDFLIQVITKMQQKDPRWGYMRKPDGRIPRDIVAYAWGSETEGTHNFYVIDFVAAGCGNTPSAPDFADPAPDARVYWNVLNKDNGFADNGVWTFRP